MRNKNLATLLATAIIVLGCQGPAETPSQQTAAATEPALPEGADVASSTITAERLEAHVARLADNEMEGRGPGSAGDRLARQYLADQMADLGLEPAFEGSWEQKFELVGIDAKAPEKWQFTGDGGELSLSIWDEFIAGSGVQSDESRIDSAELVFVGYGIQAPEFDWDDFKGADLEGKVLLMLNNDPEWDDALFEGEKRLYYGRWDYKYESAARQGAVGAIIIHTTPSAGYPWQVVQTSWTGPQFELPAGDEPRLQVAAWVTEDSARRLAELAGSNLDQLVESARSPDFEPETLGVTTSLQLANTLEQVEAANVGGLLKGAAATGPREVVVYTAHHDHLGVGEPNDQGDTIYNGALDNATGCAAVLTIAKAFTALPAPPIRDVLFLFVAAEEQGLLGSQFYAENPTYAPGRIAANLNIDGANIWGRAADLGSVGFGKSSLDAVVEQAAARQGRTVKPEQFPDRGFFYRSDQFNFAKIGVPAIYLDTGTEFIDRPAGWGKEQIEAWEAVHYHQPSDELEESWNFDGFVEDTQLMLDAGLIVATSPDLPTWHPSDEFEAARLEALAALE